MALIHLLSRAEWERAQALGVHAPPSLEAEGFLHLCTEEQLPGVLSRFFAGRTDVLALRLDDEKLGEIRWEDSYGHGVFPHLYDPLSLNAVLGIMPPGEYQTDASNQRKSRRNDRAGRDGDSDLPLPPDR